MTLAGLILDLRSLIFDLPRIKAKRALIVKHPTVVVVVLVHLWGCFKS